MVPARTSAERLEVSALEARVPSVLAGDREATEELVRGLLPRVRNLVRYLAGADSEVDDMAQQALIAVLRGLKGYRGEGRLESWVDRITVRTTLRHRRNVRAEAQRRRETGAALRDLEAPRTPNLEARREAARLLDRLPAPQREAIVMHHLVGLSVPEVAEAVGVSFDTVKSRLRLGMKKLREATR